MAFEDDYAKGYRAALNSLVDGTNKPEAWLISVGTQTGDIAQRMGENRAALDWLQITSLSVPTPP